MNILTETEWRAHNNNHITRARRYTDDHLARRKAGTTHPIFDFLFEYYPIRISHLHRWHPGIGIGLADPHRASPHSAWRYYYHHNGVTTADVSAFLAAHKPAITQIRTILTNTTANPTRFDCFGLHEWAMVYRTDHPRHNLPLRLTPAETNQVVEQHTIKCTHFDAYRFFTPGAQPLNLTVLTRENREHGEQRGCLHATMDLYKWAAKLGPLIPGDLWLDTFELAWQARILDMEASPYDCRSLGFGVVPIETPEGKHEYVRRQRLLAHAGDLLR
ncbi:MAG: 3-methyladenine DNA glycosylase, partial [Corynebacterium matruchotii]